MRDDGHMQGGGCHDRRRRDHTGRRRDSTDGHWERPSSRAFAIRRENGGRDFRMLPAALAAWMASAAAHQWWRWLTLMDDDPMSVTGYAIGALAVMLLPVVLVVPSLAAHGLIRPLRASLGDAVAVMAVAGLLSAAAAVTANIGLGMVLGATPDGRKAGEPISEGGISPAQGRNSSGTTATMLSVAGLDHSKLRHGEVLNMRINPDAVQGEEKLRKFMALIRSYFQAGGFLVQFNIVSTETLRDAQLHPENHRDLVVRVATYAAYFVELGAELQNDIIRRLEFTEC